jgi:hypothetical protein
VDKITSSTTKINFEGYYYRRWQHSTLEGLLVQVEYDKTYLNKLSFELEIMMSFLGE